MSNLISHAFKKAKNENRPALLTYTVAGDSSKKQSLEILKSISKKVDILEIGCLFVARGPALRFAPPKFADPEGRRHRHGCQPRGEAGGTSTKNKL